MLMITPDMQRHFEAQMNAEILRLTQEAVDPFNVVPTANPGCFDDDDKIDIPALVRHLEQGKPIETFDAKAPLRLFNATFKRQIPYVPELRAFLSPAQIVYLTHLLWYFSKNACKETHYAKMTSLNTAAHLHISTKHEQRIRGFFKKQGILDYKLVRGPASFILIHVNVKALQGFVDKLIQGLADLKKGLPKTPIFTPLETPIVKETVQEIVQETAQETMISPVIEPVIEPLNEALDEDLSWDPLTIHNKSFASAVVRPFLNHNKQLIHPKLLEQAQGFFKDTTYMPLQDFQVQAWQRDGQSYVPKNHILAPLRKTLKNFGDLILRLVLEDYKESLPTARKEFPCYYFTGEPLSMGLEMALKTWQVRWFRFTETLASQFEDNMPLYFWIISWMHPLYIDFSKPQGQIIFATPTKGAMLILSKIIGDIFGIDTRDRHISIQVIDHVIESPEKQTVKMSMAQQLISDILQESISVDPALESFLQEHPPLSAYADEINRVE
jgi:hypothetical protein